MAVTARLPYRAEPGRFDEAIDERGSARPVWVPLAGALDRLGGRGLLERQRAADRLIAAEGASHLLHGDTLGDAGVAGRPWRVDPIPLVFDGDTWRTIAEGVAERAALIDRVLEDVYGVQELVRDGTIPGRALYGDPSFLAPAWGVPAGPGGSRLVVYAADLVRLADGSWRVVHDLTDAPTGLGDALLHRAVIARVLHDAHRLYGAAARLTDHLTRLRSALAALTPHDRDAGRVVVLSGGLRHPGYFEQSYLARTLGYHVVEGADLIARDGRVWLRSLSGREPIDVVLRGIEGGRTDPAATFQPAPSTGVAVTGGVAGVLTACRRGDVAIANQVGAGVGSSLVLQHFLDDCGRRLLGRPLQLRALSSLWCGDPDAASAVASDLASYVLHDHGRDATETAFGDALDEGQAADWRHRITTRGVQVVAQEKVALGSSPVLRGASSGGEPSGGEAIEPGVVVLRVHAVVDGGKVHVLPGGVGRVAEHGHPVVAQTTGWAKDVWVVDPATSAGQRPAALRARQIDLRSSLPTRAAEALFWFGRHLERAEVQARLAMGVRRQLAQDQSLAEAGGGQWAAAVDRLGRAALGRAGDAPPIDVFDVPDELVRSDGGLAERLAWLVDCGSSVREFLSTMTGRLLGQLGDAPLDSPDGVERVLVDLAAVAGLLMESTVRGPSWRLADAGRRLERALVVLGSVEATLTVDLPDEVLQPVLETLLATNESLIAYRRRHRSDLARAAALDLLVRDDENPRSYAFQLDRLGEHFASLELYTGDHFAVALLDQAGRAVFDDEAELRPSGGPGPPAPAPPEVARVVLDGRGPLLALAEQVAARWFTDPADLRRLDRGTW
jgi:uncharacterized circularly permuted ATP-grasp superfamily protein/uncharacterized alpha-E superfamily protein